MGVNVRLADAGGITRALVAKHALDDFALIRIAGNNWSAASFRFQRFVAKIEPHIGHAGTDVGSMAAKAGARQDGANVAVEAHGTR